MNPLAVPSAPAARPITLGRYRLLLELGHGGMAHVYLGLATGLAGFSKLVVLKVMRDELREHPASLAMFLGEARLAARMNHPNVVQTSEVGEDEGRYFICMEYMEGQTLGRLLKKTIDEALPMGARLELVCQILEGLSYLHSFTDLDGTPLGLVHRDVSPNNVFVTFDGTVKVLDFGVAKAAGISHVTEAGTFKGKLGYAAPEQIMGRSDQRSDVFAVGVLLWEILSYRRLTQDRTQSEIVQGRIAGMDLELMRRATDLPEELLQICARAVAKEPEDRYPTAAVMRDTLRAYIAAHSLEFPPEKLRELLHGLFEVERSEMRRQIDQRMKQVALEDDHPSQFSKAHHIPGASPVFSGASGGAPSMAPVPASRKKWLAVIGTVALLGGLLGAALVKWSAASEPITPAPLAAAAAPPPAPSAAVVPGPLVTLSIKAEPKEAELRLDGAKLEGNPFQGQLPRDSTLHRLEVRAPGYKTDARMVLLDAPLELTVKLQPAAASAPAAGPKLEKGDKPADKRRTDAGSQSGSPEGAFTRKNREQGARPIDNSDPYAP